jgi:hypothetical protein
MSAFKNLRRLAFALTATSAASALLAAACSTSNSNSSPPVYGDDASNDATATGTEDASPEGTTSNPEGGGGSPEASADSSSGGGDAGDAGTGPETAPSCSAALSDAGCWTCPGTSDGSIEFLNQCAGTGVTCVSFDNSGRLPGFDAGLPSL